MNGKGIPPPPPGFVLEQDIPPPPPGFVIEEVGSEPVQASGFGRTLGQFGSGGLEATAAMGGAMIDIPMMVYEAVNRAFGRRVQMPRASRGLEQLAGMVPGVTDPGAPEAQPQATVEQVSRAAGAGTAAVALPYAGARHVIGRMAPGPPTLARGTVETLGAGTPGQAIATGAGAGAGGEIARQAAPEGLEREAELAGSLVGGAAGLGIAGAGRKVGATVSENLGEYPPQIAAVVERGAREGVPVFAPDVGGPRIRQASIYMENVPGIGVTGPRIAQMHAAKEAAKLQVAKAWTEATAIEYGGKGGLAKLRAAAAGGGKRAKEARAILDDIANSGEDWNRIIQTSGNVAAFGKKVKADQLYAAVEKEAAKHGPVPKTSTIRALDSAISQAETGILPDPALNRTLQTIRENIGVDMDYSAMRQARADIGDLISDYYSGSNAIVGKKGVGLLAQIKTAIEKDMDDFAQATGGDLKTLWKKADSYYRSEVIPYQDRQLANALKNADPDEVYGMFIKRFKGDRAARFYNSLDDKGRAAVRYGMVLKAWEKAYNAERDIFSPAKFATAIKEMEAPSGVFFDKRAKQELDGFVNLMRHVERAGQVGEFPPTGMRDVPLLMAALTGGSAVLAPVPTAVAGGGVGGLRLLLTTNAGRRLLYATAKAEPGSEAMQTLAKRAEVLISRASLGSEAAAFSGRQDAQTELDPDRVPRQ